MIFGPFSKYGLTSRQFPRTSTDPRFRKLTRSPGSIFGKTPLASARHSFARSYDFWARLSMKSTRSSSSSRLNAPSSRGLASKYVEARELDFHVPL